MANYLALSNHLGASDKVIRYPLPFLVVLGRMVMSSKVDRADTPLKRRASWDSRPVDFTSPFCG
jgi:hypothetical protein